MKVFKQFRKLLFAASLMAIAGTTVMSCTKDDNTDTTTPTSELGGSIGTRTLYSDTVYVIDRFAYVADGDVLTIQAGTIIKANTGSGAASSALIIARGGKLNAIGTASQPIIFTSVEDDIQLGETQSTLNTDSKGLWGGLIILGKAPISAGDGDTEAQIEGIPSSYTFGLYGGNVANDNSGTLAYLSIRFTGTALEPDKELQGLTLGGVGSGTSISNIEVISSDDDGIECFGGTVNVSNLLVVYQSDDGIDLDQNYAGTISNALVLVNNASAGNDALEIDGPENSTYTSGLFTIQNSTMVNLGDSCRAANLKSGAQGTINNCVFKNFKKWINVDGGTATNNYVALTLKVTNSEFNISTLITDAIKGSANDALIKTAFTAAGNSKVSTFTKGADESVFSWTWAKALGIF
ncbi:MAG: hypothetical protein H6553_02155 [Chitinophagales bacterium]|nr:hypothetical protein [Chitinophagales bacterium]